MANFFRKKNTPQQETIFIEKSDVAKLSTSYRWSAQDQGAVAAEGGDKPVSREEGAAIEELLQMPCLEEQFIDLEKLTALTSEDIIDRFLRHEPHRIVAEEGEVDKEIVTEAELDEEEDFVSEELAQVYLAQGLKSQAKETYRKLSLLNPEKSVYFAGLIEKIDKNI